MPCRSGGKASSSTPWLDWLQTAAGKTLDHAEQDQLAETRGHSAQPRGEGEDGDRQQEIVAAPKMRDQPAGDGQDDRVGGKVAGDDPLAVIDRGRQPARDIAQRHDRDRGVEHLHEGRHHDNSGDHPRIDRRAGCGLQRCRRQCRAAHCLVSEALAAGPGLGDWRHRGLQELPGIGSGWRLVDIDVGNDRGADEQRGLFGVVINQVDPDRQPLHHFDEIARGVLRWQQCQGRSGPLGEA